MALSEAVRVAEWVDAKGSLNDPALIGPPVVEFSIYKKVPSEKKRVDGRQGTIDQDPEFMAFLEALANPDAHKEGDTEQPADELTRGEKPKTTPLIEHLREKAAKLKENAAAKNMKHSRQDSQGGKGKAVVTSPEEAKKKGKEAKPDRLSDKSSGRAPEKPKESVKILSKKAAAESAAEAAKAVATQIQSNQAQAAAQAKEQASTSEPPPRSRRAGIAAAARILQRDLGLSPGNAHRKARQDLAKAEADSKTASGKEPAKEPAPAPKEPSPPPTPVEPTPSTPAAAASKSQIPASSSRRSRARNRGGGAGTAEDGAKPKEEAKGESSRVESKPDRAAESSKVPAKAPVILKRKEERKENQPIIPAPSPSPASASSSIIPAPPTGPKGGAGSAKQASAPKKAGGSSSTPSPGVARGFIKLVNRAQGVTEPLLREVLVVHGTVTSVDINKKKGFAYVDFATTEGLTKAMAASPIAVGQGSIQVLERKDTEKKGGGSGAKEIAPAPATAAESSSAAPPAPTPAATGTSHAGPSTQGNSQDRQRSGRRRGGRGRGEKESGGKDGSGSKEAAASVSKCADGAA